LSSPEVHFRCLGFNVNSELLELLIQDVVLWTLDFGLLII
jgi:hypothetical protein